MTERERIAAIKSAIEHPFHVRAFRAWSDHEGIAVGFQTEAEARAFAAGRPEPLIDLVARFVPGVSGPNPHVIGVRRLQPHPDEPILAIRGRDDFPQVES